ncbi:hypothetical protein [Enterococcus avium]|uniref:hypothetical protein n=1 Tax=Enterococcus avium TaxID=33945 RepID=UPI00209CF4D4|nr:hypothetical protein [Enterococcus avium]MDT2422078.1 hypothetical protein [Enterococcus avium]
MSNYRTAENYFSIDTKQFKELLKIGKTARCSYTFTQSRTRAGEKEILHQEEVEVILNGEKNYMLLGGRRILIETTPCNYGNKRYWFGCTICGGRTTKLFLHGGANATWKCRRCANLVYRSQQETKSDFWTWYYKAQAIAQEIDPDYWEDGFSYLLTHPNILFPNKPKNMHWKTYERKLAKFVKYVERGNKINGAALEVVLKKH